MEGVFHLYIYIQTVAPSSNDMLYLRPILYVGSDTTRWLQFLPPRRIATRVTISVNSLPVSLDVPLIHMGHTPPD